MQFRLTWTRNAPAFAGGIALAMLVSGIVASAQQAGAEPTTSERVLKAYEFAWNLSEQLIGLSTGLIGLTVTFTKDLFGEKSSSSHRLLLVGWVILTFSICSGIGALMALTGALATTRNLQQQLLGIGPTPRVFASAQLLAFAIGISTLIAHAWRLQTIPRAKERME
jgi:hypothetical protein